MFVNKDQEIPSTFYEYKQKIRDAIGADGEKKLGDYIDDFANMASLLNKRTLEKHLGKLSLILEEKLNNMGLVEIVDGSKKIKRKEGKPYIGNYKVLSKFFDSWAKQNGFNQGGSIFCIVKDEDNLPIERVKISLPPHHPGSCWSIFDSRNFSINFVKECIYI